MKEKIVVWMPLYIEIGKKKKHINLNNYRNWHYQINNKIKKEYKSIVNRKLQNYINKKYQKIELEFIMIRGDRRKVDRSNVLSIHEKFFCDAIVELGIIPDDNDKHIEKTIYMTGEVCKIKPRIEIVINVL